MLLRRTVPSLAFLAMLPLILFVACSDSTPGSDDQNAPATSSQPGAGGSTPAPEQDNPFDDPQTTLVSEYQQIQRRLGEIQRQAMQDSTLMASYKVLQDQIEAEMHNIDPDLTDKRDKLASLQEDMSQARQSGDQEAMLRINEEGSALQEELEELEMGVIDGEALSEEVQAFRDEIEAKMQEIDPETEQLIARAREIVDILQEQQASEEGEGDDADMDQGTSQNPQDAQNPPDGQTP
jgi:chromosome segregation ATPase